VRIRKHRLAVVCTDVSSIMFMLQGQPNRRTGVCDSDVFIMDGPVTERLKLCGQNSGQHGA
jgi:hypothetical protein